MAEREAEGLQTDVGEAGVAQELVKLSRVVAAEVPDEAIGRSIAALVERDAHEKPPVRPQPVAPLAQRGGVVLNVLEHLESADRVEDLALRNRAEFAADHLAGAQAAEHLSRRLARERIR